VDKVARQWGTVASGGTAGAESVGAQHVPLREAVLEALRQAIISGEYAPNERLREEDIAARFDVSRNPIREALHVLSLEGFVIVEPRRGARVATIDDRRARELFELRAPLEGLVARLAAERRTDEQLRALRRIVARGLDAATAGQLDELPRLNTEFHGLLAAAADNELLASTLGRLSDVIRWVYAARIRSRSTTSWREHEAIIDAVEARDPELAHRRGTGHIAAAAAVYAG
jgi:DNA-binding GntR family transcriptional regulator